MWRSRIFPKHEAPHFLTIYRSFKILRNLIETTFNSVVCAYSWVILYVRLANELIGCFVGQIVKILDERLDGSQEAQKRQTVSILFMSCLTRYQTKDLILSFQRVENCTSKLQLKNSMFKDLQILLNLCCLAPSPKRRGRTQHILWEFPQ